MADIRRTVGRRQLASGLIINEIELKECGDCFYFTAVGAALGVCSVLPNMENRVAGHRPECRFFRSRRADEQND